MGNVMKQIKVQINGKAISGHEGMTILEAADQGGIHIPTLCHRPELTPSGVCRVCVVDVKGAPRLVASCHTPISEGMVIVTNSPRVMEARRAVVELLLTGHTGSCVVDTEAHSCELHKLAAELEVGQPRFQVKKPRFYPVEEANKSVRRDMSKCILCGRCVRACRQIAKKDILAIAYRGFATKVVVDCDGPLNKNECIDCGVCIDFCPTSALKKPVKGVL
jgi:NADH dehydrogenase/NADH:ubiquinone oxidoreductase subunit G